MNTVQKAIQLHLEKVKETDFPTCWGDGYLYSANKTYKSIRCKLLEKGYSLVKASDFYSLAPMLGLLEIIREKKVPYYQNYSALSAIESRRPTCFTINDLHAIGLKENRILHESAHCIAYRILSKVKFTAIASKKRAQIIRGISGEAYALLTDRVFHYNSYKLCASSKILHKYHTNPWLKTDPGLSNEFRKVSDMIGEEKCFKILFFTGLLAEYLFTNASKEQRNKIINICNLTDIERKKILSNKINSFWEISFKTSLLFRYEVKRVYFKHLGIKGSPKSIVNHDPLNVFEKNKKLNDALNELINILL